MYGFSHAISWHNIDHCYLRLFSMYRLPDGSSVSAVRVSSIRGLSRSPGQSHSPAQCGASSSWKKCSLFVLSDKSLFKILFWEHTSPTDSSTVAALLYRTTRLGLAQITMPKTPGEWMPIRSRVSGTSERQTRESRLRQGCG